MRETTSSTHELALSYIARRDARLAASFEASASVKKNNNSDDDGDDDDDDDVRAQGARDIAGDGLARFLCDTTSFADGAVIVDARDADTVVVHRAIAHTGGGFLLARQSVDVDDDGAAPTIDALLRRLRTKSMIVKE